jgi:hypothetical protein
MTYDYDVVGAAGWQIVEPTRKIGLGAEVLGARGGESEELLHVEELYSMVDRLCFGVSGSVSFVSTHGSRVANTPQSQSPYSSCTISSPSTS